LILAKEATQNGLSELQYALRDSVPNRAEIGRLSPVIVTDPAERELGEFTLRKIT
jgi:hypothetical protein